MPGAGIGEVVNIVRDDPDMDEKTGVVMVAGANDILEDIPKNQFLFNVDRGVAKLKALSSKVKPVLHVVPPFLDEDQLTPHQRARQQGLALNRSCSEGSQYLLHKLMQVDGDGLNLLTQPMYDLEDVVHPTPEGTVKLLTHIQEQLGDPLILNANYVTGERIYMENRPIYIYGCRTCNQVRDIHGGYCNVCWEACNNFIPDNLDLTKGEDPFPPLKLHFGLLSTKFATITQRREAVDCGVLVEDKEQRCWYLHLNSAPLQPKADVPPEGSTPPTGGTPSQTDEGNEVDMPGVDSHRTSSSISIDVASGHDTDSDTSTLTGSEDANPNKKLKGDDDKDISSSNLNDA